MDLAILDLGSWILDLGSALAYISDQSPSASHTGTLPPDFCTRDSSSSESPVASLLLGHNHFTGSLDLRNCTGLFTLDVSVSVAAVVFCDIPDYCSAEFPISRRGGGAACVCT